MRASARLCAVVAGALALGGCGASEEPSFRVGLITDCHGIFSGIHEPTVASASLPLIERGAKPLGGRPSNGVGPVSVAGRKVELLVGCAEGTSPALSEARRLVEEEGAQVIVGPLTAETGMALREYARRRPETTFIMMPSPAQELTLTEPAPNVFRFVTEAAQSMAGLGSHAYGGARLAHRGSRRRRPSLRLAAGGRIDGGVLRQRRARGRTTLDSTRLRRRCARSEHSEGRRRSVPRRRRRAARQLPRAVFEVAPGAVEDGRDDRAPLLRPRDPAALRSTAAGNGRRRLVPHRTDREKQRVRRGVRTRFPRASAGDGAEPAGDSLPRRRRGRSGRHSSKSTATPETTARGSGRLWRA